MHCRRDFRVHTSRPNAVYRDVVGSSGKIVLNAVGSSGTFILTVQIHIFLCMPFSPYAMRMDLVESRMGSTLVS